MSVNFFGMRHKNEILLLKKNFSSPQHELSDINKTSIDIGNGQKLELKVIRIISLIIDILHLKQTYPRNYVRPSLQFYFDIGKSQVPD